MAELTEGRLAIETPLGTFAAPANPVRPVAGGDRCTFVVSADRAVLGGEPSGAENELALTLISEEFVGSVVTLHLEADNGEAFRVQKQQRELDTLVLDVGARMWARWNVADAFVLPAE